MKGTSGNEVAKAQSGRETPTARKGRETYTGTLRVTKETLDAYLNIYNKYIILWLYEIIIIAWAKYA